MPISLGAHHQVPLGFLILSSVVWGGLSNVPTATATRQPARNLLEVGKVELYRATLGLLLLRNDVGHSLVLLGRNCFLHEDSF
jgi:hypothetical protein